MWLHLAAVCKCAVDIYWKCIDFKSSPRTVHEPSVLVMFKSEKQILTSNHCCPKLWVASQHMAAVAFANLSCSFTLKEKRIPGTGPQIQLMQNRKLQCIVCRIEPTA